MRLATASFQRVGPARGGGAPSGVLPGGFPDLLVVEVVDHDGRFAEVGHAVVLGAEIRQAMV